MTIFCIYCNGEIPYEDKNKSVKVEELETKKERLAHRACFKKIEDKKIREIISGLGVNYG